jgi:hypothetical protein
MFTTDGHRWTRIKQGTNVHLQGQACHRCERFLIRTTMMQVFVFLAKRRRPQHATSAESLGNARSADNFFRAFAWRSSGLADKAVRAPVWLRLGRAVFIRTTMMKVRAFSTKTLDGVPLLYSFSPFLPCGPTGETHCPALVAAPPRWVHPCPSVVELLFPG